MKHFGKIRANIIWISTYLLCLNNFEGAISSFAQDSLQSCVKLISIDSSFVSALISYHFFLNEAFDREKKRGLIVCMFGRSLLKWRYVFCSYPQFAQFE